MKRIYMLIVFLALGACGGYESTNAPPDPATPQPSPSTVPLPDPGNGSQTSFAEAQKIMNQYCVSCHAAAAFVKSESALKGSSAKSRVQNATMPPPYATQLPAAEKQKFLNFFSESVGKS